MLLLLRQQRLEHCFDDRIGAPAGEAGANHSLAVDHERDRDGRHFAIRTRNLCIGKQNGIADRMIRKPGLDFSNAFVIQRDTDELNSLRAELLLEIGKIRNFLAGMAAPCSPKSTSSTTFPR